jgi:hypothetical protein
MTKTTPAFQHALGRSRLSEGKCPSCGTRLTIGYGMTGGGIGPYEVCMNRRCTNPYFMKHQDPEMEEEEDTPEPGHPAGHMP